MEEITNENNQLETSKKERQLENLTERNWLFIKYYLETGKVVDSYKLAGYKSDVRCAPYVLFKQLKTKIEEIGNLDVTSKARLQSDLSKVMDIPLASNKKELTLSEWLRVRKFVASITPDVQEAKPQISVLVINRSTIGKDKEALQSLEVDKTIVEPSPFNIKDVINAQPLDTEEPNI